MRNHEIVDRHGRVVDDEEGTDANGLLRDTYRLRVPLMMRDADTLTPPQHAIARDASARLFDARRPGPVYSGDRSAAAAAWELARVEATEAWRMLPAPTEAVTDGRRREKEDAASVLSPTTDAVEGARRKRASYAAMVASTCSAWRDLSPLPAADAAPPPRRDAAPLGPTFDIEEGRARKKAALDQMIADTCSAWKNPLP